VKKSIARASIVAGMLLAMNAMAANDAKFIAQSVPHTMEAGLQYAVSVTMKNTGTTPWTVGNFKLGSLALQDNLNWGINRVMLAPGEVVGPGQLKTFTFNVTAPAAGESGRFADYDFQWRVLEENVGWFGDSTPMVNVSSFNAPGVSLATGVIDPAFRRFPPVKRPVPVAPELFNSSFRGANVLEQTYEDERKCDHTAWIPSAEQIDAITRRAVDMGLGYLRMPIIVPPSTPGNSLGPQYCDSVHPEWYSADNNVNMSQVLSKVKTVLDTAHARGLKMVLVIDGYTKFDKQCYWKRSYLDIAPNVRQLVRTFSPHPALLAWDILNEPMWNAGYFGCLETTSDYASVVNAVHAMYNLVRANDPYNHPTTVGEAQTPYFKYWRDISSYASPHLYITPHQAMRARDHDSKILNVDQVTYVQGAALREIERTFGSMPVVIGEFGESTYIGRPDDSFLDTDKERYIEKFLDGLSLANRGNMLWSLSLSDLPSQQGHSVLNPDATLKPAAEAVARQVWYPLVQQLYISYLGRPADPGALREFSRQLLEVSRETSYQDGSPNGIRMGNTLSAIDAIYDSNVQVRDLIDGLANNPESRANYNYDDPTALVYGIFRNVFMRIPDQQGASFWIDAISSGNVSKPRAILSIIAGATTNTTPQGRLDNATLANKGAVAAAFTASLNTDAWVKCYAGGWAAFSARQLIEPVNSATDVKTYQLKVDGLLRTMATGLPAAQLADGRAVCQ